MSKKKSIDAVRVTDPCTQVWDEMVGNEQVRFCSHCAKDVHNLSTMTSRDALRLVRGSKGRLCIRYAKDERTGGPAFQARPVQISRRRPRLAAGVMTASLSLSTFAWAQGGTPTREPVPTQTGARTSGMPITDKEKRPEDTPGPERTASISGTVTDAAGAVVVGAEVTLIDKSGNETQKTTSNESGIYHLNNLPADSYSIAISSPGFRIFRDAISVSDGIGKTLDAALDVAQIMGAMVIARREYKHPLRAAVAADDMEKVQALISSGEDVNIREDDKTTPLFTAVASGNIEMTRLLLNFGARVNARDTDRQTPLMRLDEDATPELVQLLVNHGAKLNLTDREGNSALILAAENVDPEVLRVLIDAGADVNHVNKEGQTALMNAAYDDSLESVRLLLVAGARVNLRNAENESALDMTSVDEIEQLLVSFGAEAAVDGEETEK